MLLHSSASPAVSESITRQIERVPEVHLCIPHVMYGVHQAILIFLNRVLYGMQAHNALVKKLDVLLDRARDANALVSSMSVVYDFFVFR